MRALKVALVFVALSCAFGKRPSLAATRLTEDFSELCHLAQLIAEVEVTGQTVEAHSRVGVPLTIVTMSVIHVYKGAAVAEARLKAEYIGGFDGQYTVVSPGQPHFAPGERAIVLLSKFPGTENWHVLAGDAGQIVLTSDPIGLPIARRASSVFEYYVHDRASPAGSRLITGATLPLPLLERLLNAIVTTGRPVLEEGDGDTSALVPARPSAAGIPLSRTTRHTVLRFVFPLLIAMGALGLVWVLVRRVQ